jgi:hypothetical protein
LSILAPQFFVVGKRLGGGRMAESKKSYPMLPIAHWWNLRKKFRQSLPGVVTGSYLATVLNMEEKSANANVLPFLKTLGIIDEEGKTTERAKLWRDDQHYPEVCRAILKDVYPAELLDAVTNPTDREAAARWFARQSGAGEAAVARMAALYSVLVEADATKQPGQETRSPAKKAPKTQPKTTTRANELPGNPQGLNPPAAPGVHINLEIHISADASADQIDLIFAAMAKHIYKRV